MSAQQVLRVLVLYLLLKTDFEQLEFHLCDSLTYRTFCLVGLGQTPPKRAALQRNVSRIRPETLQALHRLVVEHGTAAAYAALTSGAYLPAPGERVVVLLCGANTDPSDLI